MASLNSSALTTPSEVREVIETALDDGTLNAYINAAYAMTLPIASNLSDCGGNTTLALIQTYLAAHFCTLREPLTRRESVGEVTVEYLRQTGANLAGGLAATPFGQMALSLDCSGGLAETGLKPASFQVWSHADVDNDVETYDQG
jgi:hypothetical protein